MFSSVCEKYGWTLDYVLDKISWVTLQMMLADSAWYDYDAEKKMQNVNTNEYNINSDTTPEQFQALINRMNG